MAGAGHLDLQADCARCAGLCCVAPGFNASADFAIDKPPGRPCPNLRDDFRCGIHAGLRQRGFPGCAAYDCFGAGQRVTQVTFQGRDWREDGVARPMFDTFAVMRRLHQLLWYLTEALTLQPARTLHPLLREALAETEELAAGTAEELLALDVAADGARMEALLAEASELARHRPGRRPIDRRGADLVGADLRGVDLRTADLRGALLIRADLRDADLRMADLMGADLRAADLRGADVRSGIFLTQPQLDAARGDARTRIPAALTRPAHWHRGRPG